MRNSEQVREASLRLRTRTSDCFRVARRIFGGHPSQLPSSLFTINGPWESFLRNVLLLRCHRTQIFPKHMMAQPGVHSPLASCGLAITHLSLHIQGEKPERSIKYPLWHPGCGLESWELGRSWDLYHRGVAPPLSCWVQ